MNTHLEPYRPRPTEEGETLAVFDRNRGAERLRVSLETFNGFEFIRLQCWFKNDQGEWWPAKGRCVTVKLKECEDLSRVLASLARDHDEHRSPARGSSSWGGGPSSRRDRRPPQRALPGPKGQPPFEPTSGPSAEFSEFD
jgi:hypothetical protein